MISTDNYEVIQTDDALNIWCEEIWRRKIFAIDTETTSLDTLSAEIVGISICIGLGKACYIPIAHKSNQVEYKDLEEKQIDVDKVLKKCSPF